MNIAMLSYHTCPLATLGGKNTGGMNVYVRELTRYLGMQNVHVDVFTRSEDDHVPHVLHDLGCGNRVVHIPAGPEFSLPKPELAGYLPEFANRILEFSRDKKIQYDLIHAHYWMSGVAALKLREQWNVPILQMFHTLGLVKKEIARSPDELEGDYRFDGENQVIQKVDRILAATQSEVSQLKDLYHAEENKITVIPPGVNTDRFYPIPMDEAKEVVGIPKEDRMVLFVGRIEPLKGIDTLIEAMSMLKIKCKKCPHYLVIIGGEIDNPEEQLSTEMERLKILSHELGIEDVIIFAGKRSQDSLPYYYSAAEVVVMPSHYESFGMVALEAMACGTPVIASEVGGLRYLIKEGETGYFVPMQNPEILAERMRTLVLNEKLRHEMGMKAAEYARDYDWSIIAREIIDVYKMMISAHKRS
jgi:D-inositol-3-phosphate glycosyltransferase